MEKSALSSQAFMAVYDIPHPLEGREVLGSLVFSESFLESCLYVQEQDGSVSRDSHFTILTADIPRYVSWLVDECDVKLSECVQQLLKQEEETCLGVVLSAGDTALMSSSDLLTTAEEGKISFFSEGILFVHPQYGSVTLPRNLICGLKFYQGDSSRTLAALFLECKSSILPFLPFQLRSASHSLAFGLQAKSNSYRSFCAQVLPVWLRQKCDVGQIVQTVSRDQLTPEQKIMLCRLDRLCKSHAPLTTLPSGSLKVSSTAPPELEAFLQHFALSSLGQEVVQRNHLEVLFSRRETPPHQHARDCKIVMTILTGIPGSCKDNLCNFLMNLNKSYGRWMVYRPPLDRHEVFCRAHFQRYLSSLLESQMNTGLSPSKCRLLVLTPGYTDVADVVQAALAHPDPVIRDAFSLGAITACVDPLSSFMEHRYAFPKLLEQCSHGLVSNVVFTGLTQEQRHPLLKQVQQLVRAANPGAAFILAEKGAVTRNEDVELILSESSFSEPLMLTARYLLYPGLNMGKFCSGDMSPTMNHHCVTFSRPLDRLQFMARCKELKPLRPDPFCGNIYHICGRVKFSGKHYLLSV
uniref:Dynein axonemal assembly factor 9 n=1 Tax=Paramormyrops kingsleyae TaxID=1676925 RepID=A0A3B3SBX5_9TELE